MKTPDSFVEKLEHDSFHHRHLCISLNPARFQVPSIYSFKNQADNLYCYLSDLVDKTKSFAACFIVTPAFFHNTKNVLRDIIGKIRTETNVPVILDAQYFGDLDTMMANKDAFSFIRSEAVTLVPLVGETEFFPFLEMSNTGLMFVCQIASNSPLFDKMREIAKWNIRDNYGVVVNLSSAEDLKKARGIVGPHVPIIFSYGKPEDLEARVIALQGKNQYMGFARLDIMPLVQKPDQSHKDAALEKAFQANQAIVEILKRQVYA